MSYQVIARKYRPQRFSEVVGQEHVTQTLANAIAQNRIGHAYLFCGPRGTGKTTIARIFAKCLNCTGGPRADFMDGDPRVAEITEGRSLDVIEIDGASNRKIEHARELREGVRFAPSAARYKVYIIDEVHMLTTEAFNALLKTLEEPPAHAIFLFATTDPEKVLATILSRCQRFDLRRIPAAKIVAHLAMIAQREGVAIEEPALHAIARGADGGLRDAEGTLDQLISFCTGTITEGDVLSMFGLAARAEVLALAEAVLRGDLGDALRRIQTLADGGKDLGRLLGDLLHHFRNLLLLQVARGDRSLIEASDADVDALAGQAKLAPSDAVTRILEVLTAGEGRLRDAGSKRIAIEVLLVKAAQARSAVSLDAVLRQLQQLRGAPATAGTSPAAPVAASAPAAENSPAVPSATPAAAPVAAESPPAIPAAPGRPDDPAALWQAALAGLSAVTRGLFAGSTPGGIADGVLTVTVAGGPARMPLVDNAANRTVLESRLKELGRPLRLRLVAGEAPAVPPAVPSARPAPAAAKQAVPKPPAKVTPVALNQEEFRNDPLIREALEAFKGEIVELRGPAS
ncbi:MAG: DNA polymerase III subunit gamma/tau [Limisphaerales bacterium]